MSIAVLIRDARRDAGLTQAELAGRAGTTQSAIARLERPGSNPRVATLERVLAATGLVLSATPAPRVVDEDQLRARLALTPAQRLALFEESQRNALSFLGRARRVDA
jgi:transcriptional regulator with XRE-family HTH domain